MSNYCDKGHWEAGMSLPCKQCRIEELEDKVDSLEREIAAYESWKDIIKQRDALQADNARLREVMDKLARLGNGNLYGTSDGNRIAQSALAATPEQSLARIRNQVLEEAAKVADAWDHDKRIAAAIRAINEPE